MLLQSFDGVIEVFPSLPDGHDELYEHRAAYAHLEGDLCGEYPAWEDCGFTGLLAPGGFEISALREAGKTVWIRAKATFKNKLRLKLPPGFDGAPIFTKSMAPGETVELGTKSAQKPEETARVLVREAAITHRRVFLGENRHTAFYKAVDSFVCAYRLGNTHRYQMTPYIFDLGDTLLRKDYNAVFHRALFRTGKSVVFFGGPKRIGLQAFLENEGYGFKFLEGLFCADRLAPDDMRRDFIGGAQDNEFWIELPRGKYDLLVISGDEAQVSSTRLTVKHTGAVCGGSVMGAGRYQCQTIPFE